MPDNPLDEQVVARILERASEFERAGIRRDPANSITEASLIAAAEEVGLSPDAVRRSIAVEQMGPPPPARLGDSILGPALVHVESEMGLDAGEVLARIDSWLVDGHHLRRDALRSGDGEWSKRSGLVGATVRTMRSATGEGKLGDFERVNAVARDSGVGSSLMRLTVNRTKNRRLAGLGGAVVAVGGTSAAVLVAVVVAPVAALATPAAIGAGVGVACIGRKRAQATEREMRRVIDAVTVGADPTRLGRDVVRRATDKASAASSSVLRSVGRPAPTALAPPQPGLNPPNPVHPGGPADS
jgi:hypothetical protein